MAVLASAERQTAERIAQTAADATKARADAILSSVRTASLSPAQRRERSPAPPGDPFDRILQKMSSPLQIGQASPPKRVSPARRPPAAPDSLLFGSPSSGGGGAAGAGPSPIAGRTGRDSDADDEGWQSLPLRRRPASTRGSEPRVRPVVLSVGKSPSRSTTPPNIDAMARRALQEANAALGAPAYRR